MTTVSKPGVTTLTTPSDREFRMTRVFNAPRHLVFEAWTNPKHLPHWLLGPQGWTMPICEIDLRPGGAWRFGWRHADGTVMEMRGVYKEVVAPERLVYTERWGDEWPEVLNTLVLTEKDGRTTMTSTVLTASKASRDRMLGTGMMDGVNASFERLDMLLKSMG